jgi:ketosteroid isomerase-like protein
MILAAWTLAAAAASPAPVPSPGGRLVEKQKATLVEMARAVNAGDARAYARVYAENAVITIRGGAVLTGRPAIQEYEAALLREFPGARLAFRSLWSKGATAVVHYAVTGSTPAGRAMGHEGLLFYRFQPSGLVAEERRYNDSLTPMAQLGALGPAPARAIPALPRAMQTHVASGSRAESANVALVAATFAAHDAGDEAGLLLSMADDVVVDELIERAPATGAAGVKAWHRRWRAAVPDGQFDVAMLAGVGDFVLAEGLLRGTLKAPLGRLAPAATPFAVHRAIVAEVKAARIVRLQAFMNGKELAEAVGQWPPRTGRTPRKP